MSDKAKPQIKNNNPVVLANPGQVAFKPFENSIFDMRGLLTLIEDLNLIERALFRGKDGSISQKARDFTSSSNISIFEELEKTGLEPASEARQLKFIKDLIIYLKSLPVVKVKFAFEPTSTFLRKISNDISALLGKKAVLDLTVDQYLVGGAVFEYGGKMSGITLGEKLEEVLLKKIGAAG